MANAFAIRLESCHLSAMSVVGQVVRWFPLIPRLQHIYRCKELADLQSWHSLHRSTDGNMRLVVDSPAHKHLETLDNHAFAREPRHVRLGLGSDGINPYKTMKSKYSVWPVVLINYNIPPWLAMKKSHLFLSLLIPGPKQARVPDVYLELVVKELLKLWVGVEIEYKQLGTFLLRGMLMWTMHDFPGMHDFPSYKSLKL